MCSALTPPGLGLHEGFGGVVSNQYANSTQYLYVSLGHLMLPFFFALKDMWLQDECKEAQTPKE